SSNQGNYVKSKNQLPSGVYSHCISLIPVEGLETGDEYCQDIDASENEFLYLVFPADGDTIETRNPVLTWTHSEPFNILSNGDYFRIVVVEMEKGQSAEAAVTSNTPVFYKNHVNMHQVMYPFDSKDLEPGKHYGWQVQKLSRGVIINKTEAWEFILNKPELPQDVKYITAKRYPNSSFYQAFNDRIFFRF